MNKRCFDQWSCQSHYTLMRCVNSLLSPISAKPPQTTTGCSILPTVVHCHADQTSVINAADKTFTAPDKNQESAGTLVNVPEWLSDRCKGVNDSAQPDNSPSQVNFSNLISTGCSRKKDCTKLTHHNFATIEEKSCDFQQNARREIVYMAKPSVWIWLLNILRFEAGSELFRNTINSKIFKANLW